MKIRESGHVTLTISIVGGLVWASFAPLSLFFSVYLWSRGLSYSKIGFLMTVTILFTSLLQPVFGAFADRYRNRKAIVSISLLVRSLALLMMSLSKDVLSISICYFISGLSLAGFIPLAQSMIADISEGNRFGTSMGRYRLFGSIGWAVACVITGLVVKDDLWKIFSISLAFSTSSFLASLLLPGEITTGRCYENTQNRKSSSAKFVVCFMASILISGMGIGATSSFLTLSLLQLGSDPFFIGLVIAIGALIEVPAMYSGGWLSDRLGGLLVLAFGELGLGVVYWFYGTVNNLYSYLLIQAVRGILYALFVVSGMAISSSLGESGRRGFYAGFYNLSFQLGTASGPYLGGLVSDYQGLQAMFALFSVLSGISASLLTPWIFNWSKGKNDVIQLE